MPIYSLDGDDSGLPRTRRSGIPYEVEALSPRESWGAGSGTTSLICKVWFDDSVQWIKDMVGEVFVGGQTGGLLLKRHVPEILRYNDSGSGSDSRVQFCTQVEQTAQGGNESGDNMALPDSKWPRVDWCKYRVTWEAMPYAILDDGDPIGTLPAMADIAAAAGAYAGARELYRYILRTRKTYSREQPIPAASTAGGFKVIDDATPANRKPIGQVGFRVVSMADVTYKWVRVPVGWPPPTGYAAPDPAHPWPPKFNPGAADPAAIRRARDKYVGTINDDWFDCAAADGYQWEPGTLLYKGFDDSTKYYDAAGDWVCDVVFTFQFKEGGWNKFLTAKGEWKEVSLDGTSSGQRPYQKNNLNNLFQYSA